MGKIHLWVSFVAYLDSFSFFFITLCLESKKPQKELIDPQTEVQKKISQIKNLTVNKLIYEPIKRKQAKIEAIKQEFDRSEFLAHTFIPTLYKPNKYLNVQSKLNLHDTTEAYIERLKMKDEEKIKMTERMKMEKELKDQIECTYKPKINKRKL